MLINISSLFILLSGLVITSTTASTIHSRDKGPGKDGDGNGITTVADLKNPACRNWYAIRDAIMGGIFHGVCNDLARASIRLSFHDAGTFSLALQKQGLPAGGADGSLIIDPLEVQRPENNGLQNIINALRPLAAKFKVSNADILHLAGILGVVACPGGPVIDAMIGRKDATAPAPLNHLPDTRDPVPKLVNLFADMGFSSREFMALIGSHSTGKQRFFNVSQAGKAFDSTVDIWDVRFYSETKSSSVPNGVFKLPGDVAVAKHSLTSKDFDRFVGKQDNWAREYERAHLKMSLLGVSGSLTDCTEIMPASIDLSQLTASSGDRGKDPTDPVIDRMKLAAAIKKYRSIWLS